LSEVSRVNIPSNTSLAKAAAFLYNKKTKLCDAVSGYRVEKMPEFAGFA
jgi:hypothetical protein